MVYKASWLGHVGTQDMIINMYKSTNALNSRMLGTHCECTLLPIDTLRSSSMSLAWSTSGCFPLTLLVALGLGEHWSGFIGLRGCFSANFSTGLLVSLGGCGLDLADVLTLTFAEGFLAAANSSSVASWWHVPPTVSFTKEVETQMYEKNCHCN